MFVSQCYVFLLTAVITAYAQVVSQSNLGINLYTPSNPNTSIPLQATDFSQINITVPNDLKIIVHGWNDNTNSVWARQMKDIYIQQNQVVILWDWSAYSTNVDYWLVVPLVKPVGDILGNLIINLYENLGILANVNCIGHSLGAHICGFGGKSVTQNLTINNLTMGNISGLDPAGPGFEGTLPSLRLDESDASHVEVIHTNTGGNGILQAIGKIDFYPNGGSVQPNCLSLNTVNCSHYDSIAYWTAAITTTKYVGTQCSTYALYQSKTCKNNPTAILGENSDINSSGSYYLTINL